MDLMTIDYNSYPNLTELEAKVLTEYQKINNLILQLNDEVLKLTHESFDKEDKCNSHQLKDNLRNLEEKFVLVDRLFKTSVYSLYLDRNEVDDKNQEDEQDYENELQSDNY
ncbi:DAD3 [[Candida] subhashii]|uniref:DASH complex subunit DAD3 n=1 Tax=[Candida] subhashii TaxID=561895 RepID=A0A8J5QQ38_9ASCO|nr:DAD3 [[Candida] subhashii]KAG7664545.1 DAD3 [[Candida] subhashii]